MDELHVSVKRLRTDDDAQKSYCCMTEVPTPWPEALCSCRSWVTRNLGTLVEGYHLELGTGEVIGHLYYAITPQALIAYELQPNVGVLYCEWVQRRFQGRGLGKLLFEAFLAEMKDQGCLGILVEASEVDDQMHVRHYIGRGFRPVYEAGSQQMLYLPVNSPEIRIQPLQARLRPGRGLPVEVTILSGYACPYEISTYMILRQVVREFGHQVVLREVILSPESLHEYGAARGIFINGQQKLFGGEPEQAIRQAILEEM
ncbi:MAG: GNAT family N-acetyltransferase [Anaerolineales bacterium]|jgi:GNAT superfamily N-acetyltransferase